MTEAMVLTFLMIMSHPGSGMGVFVCCIGFKNFKYKTLYFKYKTLYGPRYCKEKQ